MNNIKLLQDAPDNLKFMAAQRAIYERAKTIFGLQVLLTVVFAICFNFIRLLPKEKLVEFLPYIIFFSVIVSLIDLLVFVKYISKTRTYGAKVQEEFDCAVYQLPWNQYNCGAKVDKNLINDYYKKYVDDPERPIENWYDINLEGLSQEKAILLCQETNLWYDSNLREKFKATALYFLLFMAAISLIIGLALHQEVGMLLVQVVSPLMPAIVLTIKIYQENDKAIKMGNELKNSVLALKRSTDNCTIDELRKIQDKIFCSRKESPLIPEWFYKKKRAKLEEGMKINAS